MKKVRTDWSLDERLRSLVEKLIESETGLQITRKDGACIYFEFCGEEMGIEASYLDYMAEKEAPNRMQLETATVQDEVTSL